MQQRVDVGGRDIAIFAKIPVSAETRTGIAAFFPSMIQIVKDRIGAALPHVRIAAQIPVRVKQVARADDFGDPLPLARF